MNKKESPWSSLSERKPEQPSKIETSPEREAMDKVFNDLVARIDEYLQTNNLYDESYAETDAYYFSLTEPSETAASFIDEMVQYANELLEKEKIPYAFSVRQHNYDPENIRVAIVIL